MKKRIVLILFTILGVLLCQVSLAEVTSWRIQPQSLVGAEFSITLPGGYYLLNANTKDHIQNDSEALQYLTHVQGDGFLDRIADSGANYVMNIFGQLRIKFETYEADADQSMLWMMQNSFENAVRSEMQDNGCIEIECGLYEYGENLFLCAFGERQDFGIPTIYGHFITVDTKGRGIEFWTYSMDRTTIESVLSSFSHPVAQESAEEELLYDTFGDISSLKDIYIWNDKLTFIKNEQAVSILGMYGEYELPDTGELELPSSISDLQVVQIGSKAFYGSKDIVRVTVPSSVQMICAGSFDSMDVLTEAILEEGVLVIENTFNQCPKLFNVVIPSSVTSIGSDAFNTGNPYFHLTVVKGSYGEKFASEHSIPYVYTEGGEALFLSAGNTVSFGQYNGESIEWLVLETENDEALLLSKDILIERRYSTRENALWANSEINRYLNDELIYDLFSMEEAELLTAHRIYDPASPYSLVGLPGESDICHLFLLSYFEARDLLPADEQRAASKDWWLRTSKDYSEYAHYVSADGMIREGSEITNVLGIRPALWIRTDNVSGVIHIVDDNMWVKDQEEEDSVFGVGDIIQLGSYEQDNDSANGEEPLDWLVLDVNGASATLISKYCIDVQQYHSVDESVNWGQSSLRNWLNSDFLNRAFKAEDQAVLIQTGVENFNTDAAKNSMMYSYMIDPIVSYDMVWILDNNEVEYYLPELESKLAYVTEYARTHGAASNNEGYGNWLLRTDKNDERRVNIMLPYEGGASVVMTRSDASIRPVIRVDLVKLGLMDAEEAAIAIEDSRPDSEASLRALLSRMSETDRISVFEYGDYDGDGNYEAFALVKTDEGDSDALTGDLWFVRPSQGTQIQRDMVYECLEKQGQSAPYYFFATAYNDEGGIDTYVWQIVRNNPERMDLDKYVRFMNMEGNPGDILTPRNGDVLNGSEDIRIEWNKMDEAGIYYISIFNIDANMECVWSTEIWGSEEPEVLISANTLSNASYQVEVSAWIGSGGYSDQEINNSSVFVAVQGGKGSDANAVEKTTESDEKDSTKEDKNIEGSLGFITPTDGETIQVGQALKLVWTYIPGAKCYSVYAYPVSSLGMTWDWAEILYDGELSVEIPRSTLVESGYRIELNAWKDDTFISGEEIFSQVIEINTYNKFESTATGAREDKAAMNEIKVSGEYSYRMLEDGTIAFVGYSGRGDLTIPETIDGYTVTAIADGACYWSTPLTSVSIPSTVRTIGANAFSWCMSLEWVHIAEGVTRISDSAFSNDSSLFRVEFPSSVTQIGEYVCSDCPKLTYAVLPDQLIEMGEGVFSSCDGLLEIAIPVGVRVIPNSAFFCCTNLESVFFSEGLTEIGVMAFYGCESLTNVTIPSTVTTVGEWAFSFCTNLSAISIPDTTTLGEGAFSNCSL